MKNSTSPGFRLSQKDKPQTQPKSEVTQCLTM